MLRIPTTFRTKYVHEYGVLISKAPYLADGSPCWQLSSALGEPLSTPTVCLAEYGEKPEAGNVFIRGYGPNEGMFEELHKHGVVGNAVRIIEIGPFQSDIYECPILKEELK